MDLSRSGNIHHWLSGRSRSCFASHCSVGRLKWLRKQPRRPPTDTGTLSRKGHGAAAAAPCPFLLSVPVSVGGLRGCFRNHFNLPTEQWDAKQLRERPDNQW